MFGLVWFEFRSGNQSFFIIFLLSWVNVRQHTKITSKCLKSLSGGGWLESEFSDRLWLEPSLGQAKQIVPGKEMYLL